MFQRHSSSTYSQTKRPVLLTKLMILEWTRVNSFQELVLPGEDLLHVRSYKYRRCPNPRPRIFPVDSRGAFHSFSSTGTRHVSIAGLQERHWISCFVSLSCCANASLL